MGLKRLSGCWCIVLVVPVIFPLPAAVIWINNEDSMCHFSYSYREFQINREHPNKTPQAHKITFAPSATGTGRGFFTFGWPWHPSSALPASRQTHTHTFHSWCDFIIPLKVSYLSNPTKPQHIHPAPHSVCHVLLTGISSDPLITSMVK